MKSHFSLASHAAVACAISATAAMVNGAANAQLAADSPTDPAYADGWQAGDNGGFGFTGWSFYGTYTSAVQHAMDSSSPYHLGLAWTLYLPNGNLPQQSPDSPNPPPGPGGTGTDLSRAGRGFAEGALQVGQTLSVVVNSPTERTFYKGYTISLISGTNNVGFCCPAGVQRLRVGTFEYFTYGGWYTPHGPGYFNTCGLFDTDTADGLKLDIKLTGVNSYSLTMTPLAHPELAYHESGTMTDGSGMPINWIMFEHYNTDSDFFDAAGPHVAVNPQRTDFYISSMQILEASGGLPPEVTARPAPNVGGKNPPGPKQSQSNPNGFFQLLANDDNDPNPSIYIADSASSFVAGPYANGDIVKITVNAGAPGVQPMGGGVKAHITVNGTPLLYATDADGNSSVPVSIAIQP
jgi:hypothetical protein